MYLDFLEEVNMAVCSYLTCRKYLDGSLQVVSNHLLTIFFKWRSIYFNFICIHVTIYEIISVLFVYMLQHIW